MQLGDGGEKKKANKAKAFNRFRLFRVEISVEIKVFKMLMFLRSDC